MQWLTKRARLVRGLLSIPVLFVLCLCLAAAGYNVAATINVGQGPYGVAISPDGSHVYVANRNDNTMSVIQTSNNSVTATVNVG
jgi:YVTN family beta-propeller protein